MAQRDESLTANPRLAQLGAFLRSRRARLAPSDVGLRAVGRRRTAGLRREEVAQLAGMSPAWYTHLEQGRDVHPSREALDALADALRLDATERAYLFQLAYGPRRPVDRRTGSASPPLPATPVTPSPAAPDGAPPSLRRLLDALGPLPALVVDRCWDVVGRNAAFVAVLPGVGPGRTTPDASPLNLVEYVVTNAALRAGMGDDWAQVARLAVDGTMLDVRSAPGLTLLTYVPCDPETADGVRRLTAVPPR